MISLIQTLNYRCLKHITRPLSPFNVLAGPNASGKTAFLDTISFLSHFISRGPEAAPAYLGDFEGICLVEEPENGIHPRAAETMIQSLSSVYNAQILLATHSPVILGLIPPG